MAVTINKKFWGSSYVSYFDLSKIVFTSPNITSPAAAGTRSHILPGGKYIGTWYEATDYMFRAASDQRSPKEQLNSNTKQDTFFNTLTLTAPFDFNIHSTAQVTLERNDLSLLSERVVSDSDNYASVSNVGSYTATTSGVTLTLLGPTGASEWVFGDNKAEYVWWNSSGISRYENVQIYVSYNDGGSWTLNQTAINDGQATVIPTQSSNTAKVKVVFNDVSSISDSFVINSYISYKPTDDTTMDKLIPDQPYLSTSDAYTKVAGYTLTVGGYVYKILYDTYCESYKYSIADNMWVPTGWSNSPGIFNTTGAFIIIDNIVYILSGGTYVFWSYDIINDSWASLDAPIVDIYSPIYMDNLGEADVIYCMSRCTVQLGLKFYKYTVSTDTWSLYKSYSLAEYSAGTLSTSSYFWKNDTKIYTYVFDKYSSAGVYGIGIYNITNGFLVYNANVTESVHDSPPISASGTYSKSGSYEYHLSVSAGGIPGSFNLNYQYSDYFGNSGTGVILATNIAAYVPITIGYHGLQITFEGTDVVNVAKTWDIHYYNSTSCVMGKPFFCRAARGPNYFFGFISTDDNTKNFFYSTLSGTSVIGLGDITISASNFNLASGINNQFYITEANSTVGTSYLYRYDIIDDVLCYLPGSDTLFDEITPTKNITCLDDTIYIVEGVKSNRIWNTTFSGTWSSLSSTPLSNTTYVSDPYFTHKYWAYLNNDGTNLYYIRGQEEKSFYKYNMSTWSQLLDLPYRAKSYFYMDYVSASGCFYAIQGATTTGFWRYNNDNTWDILAPTPSALDVRCSIKAFDDSVYVLKGNISGKLYKYSTSANTWDIKTDYPGDITKIAWGITNSGTLLRFLEDSVPPHVYSYDTSADEWLMNNVVGLTSSGILSITGESSGRYIYALSKIGTGVSNDTVKIYKIDMNDFTVISGTSNYDPESSIPGSWLTPEAITSGAIMYNTSLTLSGVVGTEVLSAGDKLYCWSSSLLGTTSSNTAFVNPKNSVIFEVTLGEAYGCKLTAWDDDTHTTTNNKILAEGHYKATCVAYRAGLGTKQLPTSNRISNSMVHPPASDIILKGNDSFYGTFDLRFAANGGYTGSEHGEYILFMPRLDDIDETFTNGNYDFVTTLHYSYT
jgi:hypothetical protein